MDGTFDQSDNSEVVAGFLDLTGTYDFTNGMLFVGTQFINGTFNQQGGKNLGAVDMESTNSDYELFDGVMQGNVIVRGGTFNQWSGTNSATLVTGFRGLYNLAGGVLMPGDLFVGSAPPNYGQFVGGSIRQTGGTNLAGNITAVFATYTLSNGVLAASSLTLTTNTYVGNLDVGEFDQYGGYDTNGGITMIGGTNDYLGMLTRVAAKYNLYAGILETPAITMTVGDFGQGGGTNNVGTLSMDASIYAMGGGVLAADEIQLANGSDFWNMGGTLVGSRNVMMDGGGWTEESSGAQLGQLQLGSSTGSAVYLQSASCVVQFADSSSVPWASAGRLTIENWSGSLNGGGSQQVLFGTSASGLTAQQVSQVQFLNPAGLPNGTYAARILSNGEVVPDSSSSSIGPVNAWINSASGNWDEATNWSLGVLPDGSHSILIGNSGWKAVAINASTPINFPSSMIVSNLFIEGATNTENSLLLNNIGTNVPLTVLNGLTLLNDAQILNFNSGLDVQSGTFLVTNSDVIQDGGFIRATNAPMYLSGSEFDITNGVFEGGSVSIGFPVPSRFNQYGGSVKIANVGLVSELTGTNANEISLYGGTLELPGGMYMLGGPAGLSYFQDGGTNYTTQITVEPGYGGGIPGFTLNGGLLVDSGIFADGGPTIIQNGGSHVVTNAVSLAGESDHGESAIPATYDLNAGTLSAGTVSLNSTMGTAAYNQTNGIAYVGEFHASSSPLESYWASTVNLSGGTLACSNVDLIDGSTFIQTAGAVVVSNSLNVDGYIEPGPKLYSTYQFTDGTLFASNINVGGIWVVGDSTGTNRISNPGTCTLSNALWMGNAVEQLGRFILPGMAAIHFTGNAGRLSFANSSGEAWTGGATLVIFNWSGNASGGGVEQLKFGTDQSGLTAAQLNQIRFRVSTNLYSAKILNTGEVVPDQLVAPQISYTQQGNQLTLNWLPGYKLQTATAPAGPYSDIWDPGNLAPPYSVNMTEPQRYFRLVPQ